MDFGYFERFVPKKVIISKGDFRNLQNRAAKRCGDDAGILTAMGV